MKILYGVQGTGNGHVTRARSLNRWLRRAGIEVDYLFSGRPPRQFFDMEAFGDWTWREGLTFTVSDGRVRIAQTLAGNSPRRFVRDVRKLPLNSYDAVISDFEPVSAWAARKAGKPCIGLGHQYAFRYPVPKRGEGLLVRTILRNFAPADHYLGLHWHHFNSPILPPIVEPPCPGRRDGSLIVVYLPFESPQTVQQLLNHFCDYRFLYYGRFNNPAREGNIHFRPLSRQGFQTDLSRAGGVIANAGFELSSECFSLGTKLLVKPLKGQMEQASNALALQCLGLGHATDALTPAAVQHWLDRGQPVRVGYPDVARLVVDWLAAGRFQDVAGLADHLWSRTRWDERPVDHGMENHGNATAGGVAPGERAGRSWPP